MPDSSEDAAALIESLKGTLPRLEYLARVDALVAEFPDSDELRAKQTGAYFRSGDRVRSLELANAHLAAGRSASALAVTGSFALRDGDFERARTFLAEALAKEPANIRVALLASSLATFAGDTYEALHCAETAQAAKPETPRIESAVLRAMYLAGRFAEAEARWNAAEPWFQGTYDYWRFGGYLALARHDFVAAERALRQAIALRPYSSGAWAGLSGVLLLVGRPAEAETAARNSLDEEPENARALRLFGKIARGRGRLGEADDFERQAVERSPLMKGLAHLDQATTFAGEGRRDEALRALALAYKESPEGSQGRIRRLHVHWLAMWGRWDELETLLPQIGPSEANWPGVVYARARLLGHKGRTSEAIALLEQPEVIPSVANRALLLSLYRTGGGSPKMEELATSLAQTTVGSPADYTQAHAALLRASKPELADDLLARGRHQFPSSDILQMYEAKRLIRAGDRDQARRVIAGLPPAMRAEFYPRYPPWSRKYWKRFGRIFQIVWKGRSKK